MKNVSATLATAISCVLVFGLVGTADCQTWTTMTNAPPVSFGAMMLLTDGRVLIHEEPNCSGSTCKGKDYTAWYTLTPDINGSYVNGTWTQVASLPGGYAPLYFSSAVLPDGKVAIQGGEYQCPGGSCTATWQSLGAFFDPVANTWTAIAPPVPNALGAMGDSESVVLGDGTWMIGICCAQFVGYTPWPDYVYFNEGSLTYTPMGNASDGQTTEYDEAGFNLLPYNPSAPSDSQVLMVNVPLVNGGPFQGTLMTSQVYDETTNTWAAPVSTQVQLWDADCGTQASASYELGPVMLLPNGKLWGTGASSCQAGHTALYDPVAGTWTAMGDFPNKGAANDAPGATEINGNAIIGTSPFTNESSAPVTFYEFNSTTNTISALPTNPPRAANDDSFVGHLLVLPTGQILWTDFSTTGMAIFTSAGTYDPSWQPTISVAPSSLTIGQTYSISGTQFNGVTTGAAYGDDFQDNTNYPLVRIVNNSTSHVFYARTHGHSTMAVQTGSLPVSTNFDVPVMETGPCQLYVVTNGIPSAPSACNVAQPTGIYSPSNGSVLTSATATFSWGGDPNATAYWVDIGSAQGGNNYYSSGNLSTSTLSLTVSTLPSDGSTVWVRWYYMISGNFQYIDYSYTALGGAASKGTMNTPAPGSVLTSASPAFTWSAGTGATSYWLDIGGTPGANNYYTSGNLGNVVTVTSKNVPENGTPVYVTLYSLVGSTWYSNTYTYTALNNSVAATMSTPANGSTLTSSTVTFTWVAGTATATSFHLDAGSTAGANNYYSSATLSRTTRSVTVTTLPTNGSTVYVTLYSLIGGVWEGVPYTYTAVNAATSGGAMTTPNPGSTLTSNTVTFDWTAGAAATAYWVDIGGTPGANNYYTSGNLGNVLTTTVSGLPSDGSTVYVTLYSRVGVQWIAAAYTYNALNATTGLATMQSPTPGTTLHGTFATFSWSADPNATAYWVDIGSSAGGNNVYSSGNLGTAQTTTVYTLPADGSTIYVSLYSYVGGQWVNNPATYTSAP